MKKLFHLTQSGIDELQAEKVELLQKRIETAEAIKVARELGDLAENAEYQSARAEQERTDARLEEIDRILANAEIIKASKSKEVILGSTVTLSHPEGKQMTVQLVGTIEADPMANKISDESPIGQALLGKKEGDAVPTPKITYTVLSVQ
ncbi:transcription elongation factor GreA [Candidatus Saccharibacteria bacterium]|nr:transcription elongation factor GreA [Candidatus Saccharibacteria bacterium]